MFYQRGLANSTSPSSVCEGDAGGDDAPEARLEGQTAEGRQDRRLLAHQRADRGHDRDARRPRRANQVGGGGAL